MVTVVINNNRQIKGLSQASPLFNKINFARSEISFCTPGRLLPDTFYKIIGVEGLGRDVSNIQEAYCVPGIPSAEVAESPRRTQTCEVSYI